MDGLMVRDLQLGSSLAPFLSPRKGAAASRWVAPKLTAAVPPGRYHPDKGSAATGGRFKAIHASCKVLSDATQKADYDAMWEKKAFGDKGRAEAAAKAFAEARAEKDAREHREKDVPAAWNQQAARNRQAVRDHAAARDQAEQCERETNAREADEEYEAGIRQMRAARAKSRAEGKVRLERVKAEIAEAERAERAAAHAKAIAEARAAEERAVDKARVKKIAEELAARGEREKAQKIAHTAHNAQNNADEPAAVVRERKVAAAAAREKAVLEKAVRDEREQARQRRETAEKDERSKAWEEALREHMELGPSSPERKKTFRVQEVPGFRGKAGSTPGLVPKLPPRGA